MYAAALKAIGLLFSPRFRTVLLKSLALTVALLAVAIIAIETVFASLVVLPGWIETTLQIVGGLGLVVASVFLIAPITSLIAGLYLDDIAGHVEQTGYPDDPPGRELGIAEGLSVSLRFGLAVIGVNILALMLLLVPGVNIIVFYAANGYLLGREYFELAAMRYLGPAEARVLRRDNRVRAFLSGLAIAGMVSVPVVNLFTPLFATAFMVHNVKDVLRRRAR